MPDTPLTHLWIPADRVRTEPIVPRGGGDTYQRNDLAEHSRALLEAFNRSIDEFRGKADLDLATDLIVEIATAPDRAVTKERVHLRNLGFEVIAFSPDDASVAIARIPRDSLGSLQRKIERYAGTPRHVGRSNLAAIEAIRPVGVERKVEPLLAFEAADDRKQCLITLYSALPEAVKIEIASRIAVDLGERGSKPTLHRFDNGMVAIAAELTRGEMERVSEQYMFVRSVESNADFATESGMRADPVPALLQIDAPRCRMPVVVVDSGVNAGCSLLDGLVVRSINELPANSVGPHLSHGTFVASRVVYGDGITGILSRRAQPWCPVIDVQVTGDDGLGNKIPQSAVRLGEILQRIVPALCDDTKVFNVSLGFAPISDGFYSSLARLIDFLSRKYRVLFVISAGNIKDPCAVPPAHFAPNTARILFPAESLLSLTVGSVAKYWEPNCVAGARELAPYSRRGPGADQALKPELAAHGGNVFFVGGEWATSPRIAAYGLCREGTHLEYATGTSFSAPIVSQFAARLFDAYPDAHPNLVRALLCHFADPILTPAADAPLEAHHFCGFGEPDIDRAMFSGASSASYLYQGEIRSDAYAFIPFHVPAALAANPAARLTIRGTVVFDPPVSTDDSVNYSLCRIAGQLRKRTEAGARAVSIGGAEDDVLYPWNPLVHFKHNFRRGYASGEWELRLRLMTRGSLPNDHAQSFSVIIEVLDSSGLVDVRGAIEAEVGGAYLPIMLSIAA